MKKRNRKTEKISLKKIKVAKLNNLITIKGGRCGSRSTKTLPD